MRIWSKVMAKKLKQAFVIILLTFLIFNTVGCKYFIIDSSRADKDTKIEQDNTAEGNDSNNGEDSTASSEKKTADMTPDSGNNPDLGNNSDIIKDTIVTTQVPILYYHAINDEIVGDFPDLFVSPSEFRKQMQYLKENNFTAVTFEDFEKLPYIEKPILITFDDGYEDNYINAYPILKEFNLKETIFIVSGFIGNPSILNADQMREMKDLVSFESHTVSHPYLTSLSDDELEKELKESKETIQSITGREVLALAYPTGDYNQRVINATQKYYKYGAAMGGGIHKLGTGNYEIKRIYVPRRMTIEEFKQKVEG